MSATLVERGVPDVLTGAQIEATARYLVSLQRPNGQIPWFDGGHCDPWNHVEVAMALCACGYYDEARAAYRWLARAQLADGSWFNYYLGDRVKDARLDTNVCAYIATGLYHYVLASEDLDFARDLWPHVERALDFVLRWQAEDGTIRWSLDAQGRVEPYALLTGSSSIFHSLRCAVALAERLGVSRPDWELAAGRLGHAVAHHPGAFAPKNEFAMDWYYPIFSGALRAERGRLRLADGYERHVMDGLGVRCVSTNDWVTAAETAECVLALDALGLTGQAFELFTCTRLHRREDGAYWTGIAYPGGVTFPHAEATSYTAAAVVLAADALSLVICGRRDLSPRRTRRALRPRRTGLPTRLAAREHPQRPLAPDVLEGARARREVDLVGRATALARVLKDVVDEQQPARHDLGGPVFVVGPGDRLAVPPVDEEQVEGLGEVLGHHHRRADEPDYRRFEAGVGDRALPVGQRVEAPVAGVDEALVEVLPARLVLLAAVVVVEGVENAAGLLGRGAEVDGRLAAPGPDLEPRALGRGAPGVERVASEREPLGAGHEALRPLGQRQQVVAAGHDVTRLTMV